MQVIDVLNSPWAIQKEKYAEIRTLYYMHAHGEHVDIAAVEQAMGRKLENKYRAVTVVDGVAILSIEGMIAKRMNLFAEISGGVSTQMLQRDFAMAMDDQEVHSIILNIDSPGGEVSGTQDFASQVFAARGKKPVIAVCNGTMASGAYWIGSSADQVFITANTDMVGSIGVVISHTDMSKAEAQRGMKVTEITAGKYKRIASEHEPLSAEGHDELKSVADQIYTVFVNDIARNRNTDVDTVLSDMADGRIFIGQKAIAAGLVDGVKTASQVLAKLKDDRRQLLYPSNRNSATALNSKGGSMENENTTVTVPADITAMRKLAFDEGFTKGRENECARIRAVREQSMPGHEDLVVTLMFDGKTTGEQAAVQVLAAERKKLGAIATDLRTDAGKAAAHTVTETTAAQATRPATVDMSNEDIRAIAKEEWAKDAKLHREFSGEASYVAFRENEVKGRIRILRDKTKAS
jgi:signal peptide peptidase SppA